MNRTDLATVLAALRYYQENGQGDPSNRSDAIHEIAHDGGEVISLDADGIDDLCERLTTAPDQSDALAFYALRPAVLAAIALIDTDPDALSLVTHPDAVNAVLDALAPAFTQEELREAPALLSDMQAAHLQSDYTSDADDLPESLAAFSSGGAGERLGYVPRKPR